MRVNCNSTMKNSSSTILISEWGWLPTLLIKIKICKVNQTWFLTIRESWGRIHVLASWVVGESINNHFVRGYIYQFEQFVKDQLSNFVKLYDYMLNSWMINKFDGQFDHGLIVGHKKCCVQIWSLVSKLFQISYQKNWLFCDVIFTNILCFSGWKCHCCLAFTSPCYKSIILKENITICWLTSFQTVTVGGIRECNWTSIFVIPKEAISQSHLFFFFLSTAQCVSMIYPEKELDLRHNSCNF